MTDEELGALFRARDVKELAALWGLSVRKTYARITECWTTLYAYVDEEARRRRAALGEQSRALFTGAHGMKYSELTKALANVAVGQEQLLESYAFKRFIRAKKRKAKN